jgi:hypothetical protein
MLPSSASDQGGATYFRNVWDSGHLDLLTTVVRVVRRGFCCSPNALGPEKATHFSDRINNPDECIVMLEERYHGSLFINLTIIGLPTL